MDVDMDNWLRRVSNNIIVLDNIFVIDMDRFWARYFILMKSMCVQRIMIEHWCQHNRISLVFIRYSMFLQRKYQFNLFPFIRNQLKKISYVNWLKIQHPHLLVVSVTRCESMSKIWSNWKRSLSNRWIQIKERILSSMSPPDSPCSSSFVFPYSLSLINYKYGRIWVISLCTMLGILLIRSLWR